MPDTADRLLIQGREEGELLGMKKGMLTGKIQSIGTIDE